MEKLSGPLLVEKPLLRKTLVPFSGFYGGLLRLKPHLPCPQTLPGEASPPPSHCLPPLPTQSRVR